MTRVETRCQRHFVNTLAVERFTHGSLLAIVFMELSSKFQFQFVKLSTFIVIILSFNAESLCRHKILKVRSGGID